jgi:hypothetical protein
VHTISDTPDAEHPIPPEQASEEELEYEEPAEASKPGKKAKGRKKRKRPRVALPPELERYRKISVPWAAEIKGISVDGFKRYYAHLIEQVSPRRQAVTLGRLLDEPESEAG